jgi:hypothetical protein
LVPYTLATRILKVQSLFSSTTTMAPVLKVLIGALATTTSVTYIGYQLTGLPFKPQLTGGSLMVRDINAVKTTAIDIPANLTISNSISENSTVVNAIALVIPTNLTISNATPTKSPILFTPKHTKLEPEYLEQIEKVKSEAANRLAEEKKAVQEEEDRKVAEEQAKKIQKEKEEKEAREKEVKQAQAEKDADANRRGTIWSLVAEGLQFVYCTLRHHECEKALKAQGH